MTLAETDVLIIGGGPAGTTFAALMAKKGWNVTLLEKDHHPRFHIGESLLPMNMPILERLGVMDKIRSFGVPKLGADFTAGNSGNKWQTYYFRDALGDSPPQAFEVRRSEFDHALFENARDAGAHLVDGMKVTEVHSLENGTHNVDATDDQGATHSWNARYLVDASGRDTFLSGRNGWKVRNPRHASAAVFGHFKGVKRRPGEDQGNISLYWFEHGWIWMIPLNDDIMSVGAVCRPNYLKTRKGSIDTFLLETLNGIEEVRERMAQASQEMPAQATGNYSYLSRRMGGPGYLMIGDAYAFIDPVFSSGVYLAMSSAERGVKVAEAWLSGSRVRHSAARWRYERETNRGLSAFSWFIYRFTSPTMNVLMSNPRNMLQVMQAVISMLAGDVYNNRSVRRRLLLFKTIYNVSWLINWKDSVADRRISRANINASLQADE